MHGIKEFDTHISMIILKIVQSDTK